MLALPFHAVSVGLLLAGLMGFSNFWIWYLCYFGLFGTWIAVASWAKRPNGLVPDSEPLHLTEDEIEVIRRHPIYFTAPFVALQLAAVISVIQLCAIACAALLAYRAQWLAGVALAVIYPLGGTLTVLVNPGRLLRYHQARGTLKPEGQALLDAIESIERKHADALSARHL